MMSALAISVTALRRLRFWNESQKLFTVWWQRIRSRYELERLLERDLADMGLCARIFSTRYKSRSGKNSDAAPVRTKKAPAMDRGSKGSLACPIRGQPFGSSTMLARYCRGANDKGFAAQHRSRPRAKITMAINC